MHVCTLHWKELAAVRDQSRTVASALSPLRNIPLQFSWISQLSLGVCLVSTFNSSICAALCIAGVWVINPMWRQASHLCSWAWPSLFPNRSFHWFFPVLSFLEWHSDNTVGEKEGCWCNTTKVPHLYSNTKFCSFGEIYARFRTTLTWGTFQLSASAKGKVLLPNILLWQHRHFLWEGVV